MSRSRGDALRSVLLAVAVLAGLVGVRWSVTGSLGRPLAPPASLAATAAPPPATVAAPPGTRLSLGGREPVVVDPASGLVSRIPPDPDDQTVLFRQGAHTILVANRRVRAIPAGLDGPQMPLGRAVATLPARADDRVWLVDVRYGPPQRYTLVEVGLPDGRAHARFTLPYQTTPVAVVSSGIVARTIDDDLVIVDPRSGRRDLLARSATFIDARGDRVAWLAGRDLHVRRLRTGAELVVPPPDGSPDWNALGGPVHRAGCCFGLGAFAPDGRRLALYARLAGPGARGLAVVDLERGAATLLPGSEGAIPNGRLPCLAWASNGWLYFFAAGPGVTSIGVWRPGDAAAGLLLVDVARTLDVVPSTLAAN